MQLKVLFLTLMTSFKSYACTEAMKPYTVECKAQDKFTKLTEDYLKNQSSVDSIKGFVIPRALGKTNYFSAKNELLTQTETTLEKNKDWIAWSAGQKYMSDFHSAFLEFNDILKLHKIMFSAPFDFSAGKIRTSFGETNPVFHINCSDQLLNDNAELLLENYDIKSNEGYALLELQNIANCADKKSYSGDLVFYKGASMKMELKSWVADFNDMLNRYYYQTADDTLLPVSPYEYLADMKRWFIAIHPFSKGNELMANVLIDYATERLQLPPLSLIYPHAYLKSAKENRAETLEATQDSLIFLENCLYETKVKLVSPQCTTLD
jgi:fido (protein-threonine AMPylation protein)